MAPVRTADSGEVGEVGEGVAEDPVVHGQSQQFLFRGAESLRRSIEEQISYFQRRTYVATTEASAAYHGGLCKGLCSGARC